jgi:Putative phage abortive infection protein
MKNSQPIREKLLQHSPWIVAIAFGIIVAAYIWTFRALPYNEKTDAWGQFGDLIGGLLNPLISLFTLLVAVSVWRLQKLELAETRAAIKAQTFDQFFMSVLASHRAMSEQVSLISVENSNTLQTGKRAIDSYRSQLHSLKDRFDYQLRGTNAHNREGEHTVRQAEPDTYLKAGAALVKTFDVWRLPPDGVIPMLSYFCVRYYKRPLPITITFGISPQHNELSFENIFGHIFRSTYQILKLIDEQFSKPDDRKTARRYVNLLRAQMSESEFIFFALSALTKDGEKSWARSVRLDFFENRLQNTAWTEALSTVFQPSEENTNKANLILKEDKNAY